MKVKKYRLFALLIALSMILAGCGNREEDTSATTTAPETTAPETTAPSTTAPEATAPSTEPSVDVTSPSENPSPVAHLITVTNLADKPLSKVDVRVYSDATLSDLIAAGKTDTNGQFSFSRIPADGYTVVLSKLPTGYGAAEQYTLTGEQTVIKLASADVSEEELYSMKFRLGDAMPDFSLTGPDGTGYKLSELLIDKKAVVLNFWYMGCDPCKQEFPHIQQAYEKYSDDIALLAINPVDADNQQIAQFMQEQGYTFPMLKGDTRWSEMFSIAAFPLTVVIDRYGNICLTHSGGVPDTGVFENLFAYFCADNYVQEYYKSIHFLPKIGE